MNCSRVASIRKLLKQFLFDRRIFKSENISKFSLFVLKCNLNLPLYKISILFCKELRWYFLSPFSPVPFIGSLIDKRELLFAIFGIKIITLTTMLSNSGLNITTERIIGVFVYCLKNLTGSIIDLFFGCSKRSSLLWLQ